MLSKIFRRVFSKMSNKYKYQHDKVWKFKVKSILCISWSYKCDFLSILSARIFFVRENTVLNIPHSNDVLVSKISCVYGHLIQSIEIHTGYFSFGIRIIN